MKPELVSLFAPIANAPVERAIFAYLNSVGDLLGVHHTSPGTDMRLEIPFRAIAADALAFDATQVIMAHNHPSGLAEFSNEDIAVTQRLARALDAIGVRLVDHILLTRDAVISLRARGLI